MFRSMLRCRPVLRCAWPIALILLAAALPARAAEVDPVVQEVVHMLEGGVSEPVVASWLESSGRQPAHVDSAELVALRKAKASDDLMKRLIELASGAPAATPAPSPAQPPAAPATAPEASRHLGGLAAGPPAAAPVPPTPQPAPAPTPAPAPAASAGGGIPVRFHLTYRPFTAEEDAPSWNLFVYLDGRLLTGAKPAMISLTTRSWDLDRSLPAGHHVIRLVQERHERHLGGERWLHVARVAPEPLAFDLLSDAGGSWRVSLELDQVKIRRQGPLDLRVTRGDREVATVAGGGEPDTWKPLCEDVEASAAERAGDRHRDLARCVRWADLFPGIAGVPSRDEVRAELERDRFQPRSPAP
jgi:hypothetical protein